jgi:hypothetical protein
VAGLSLGALCRLLGFASLALYAEVLSTITENETAGSRALSNGENLFQGERRPRCFLAGDKER